MDKTECSLDLGLEQVECDDKAKDDAMKEHGQYITFKLNTNIFESDSDSNSELESETESEVVVLPTSIGQDKEPKPSTSKSQVLGLNLYNCDICYEKMESSLTLLDHKLHHLHNDDQEKVEPKHPETGQVTESTISITSVETKQIPKFKADVDFSCSKGCGLKFENDYELKDHLITQHWTTPTGKTMKCFDCNYEGKSKALMRSHLLNHYDIFPASCNLCPLKFKWASALYFHRLKEHPQEVAKLKRKKQTPVAVVHKPRKLETTTSLPAHQVPILKRRSRGRPPKVEPVVRQRERPSEVGTGIQVSSIVFQRQKPSEVGKSIHVPPLVCQGQVPSQVGKSIQVPPLACQRQVPSKSKVGKSIQGPPSVCKRQVPSKSKVRKSIQGPPLVCQRQVPSKSKVGKSIQVPPLVCQPQIPSEVTKGVQMPPSSFQPRQPSKYGSGYRSPLLKSRLINIAKNGQISSQTGSSVTAPGQDEKALFTCLHKGCEFSCSLEYPYRAHLLTHDPPKSSNGRYECLDCVEVFQNRVQLLKHMGVHYSLEPLQCPSSSCSFTTFNKDEFNVHQVVCHQDNTYKTSIYFDLANGKVRE